MKYGVNITGGEGWAIDSAGTLDYRMPSEWQLEYFAAKGFTQIRVMTSWELLQPTLNGALNTKYINEIKAIVAKADALGLEIVLDVHNYGKFKGELIGSPAVPVSTFVDLWGKLASTFKAADNVTFGLMNEPLQETAADWLVAANAAISAIRAAGADQLIYVPGAYWDGAWSWVSGDNDTVIGGPGKIVDPLHNYAFEVHQYLDDTSGQHDWVVSETIGVERLTAITEWARATGSKLYLGEYGVGDSPVALAALDKMLAYMEQNADIWVANAYFAAGAVGTGYIFTVEPEMGLLDQKQTDILDKYIARSGVENDKAGTLVDTFDANGNLRTRVLTGGDGQLERSITVNPDGTYTFVDHAAGGKITVYDANYLRIGSTSVAANGEKTVSTYQPGMWDPYYQEIYRPDGVIRVSIVHEVDHKIFRNYDAAGKLTTIDKSNIYWQLLERDTYNSNGVVIERLENLIDGARKITLFDGVSGLTKSSTIFDAGSSTASVKVDYVGGVVTGVQTYIRTADHAAKQIGTDAADTFFYFGNLRAIDEVVGGAGADNLALQGDYSAGLQLNAGALNGIETLSLLSGSDARFGDTRNARYSYNITTHDTNVAPGQQVIINAAALLAGENLTIDASAERDGRLFIYAGRGLDRLTGGNNADDFFFAEQRWQATDRVVGGGGDDNLVLRGNYSGADRVVFRSDSLSSVETVSLLSASDVRFVSGGTAYSYDITTVDQNASAGTTMTINGARLTSGETMKVNASAETDANLRIFGGAGSDNLVAGAGNDLIYGGMGADRLEGGAGADVYRYQAVGESTGASFDQLIGFTAGQDVIDLPSGISVVGWSNSAVGGALSRASFDVDLGRAIDPTLQPNTAMMFEASSGDLAGRSFLIVDADGDGVYTTGKDFVFELVAPTGAVEHAIGLFV